ncbi:MAG TPA: DUF1365 domain-containing protein [Gemmatales bacterium]|nr:DUF1365 domain-containing protein [Gemmatales bacterium]
MLALVQGINKAQDCKHSCIFEGTVEHTRLKPVHHHFSYSVFMMYLDLDELDHVVADRWFWSTSHFSLAWFRRQDHLGDPRQNLKDSVRLLVHNATSRIIEGPIRLLTNLRYYGYVMNPVSYYYCFDRLDQHIEAIVAEIHNTPWGERHCYVIEPAAQNQNRSQKVTYCHAKTFHVSPFMPMELRYHWQFTPPDHELKVDVSLSRQEEHIFYASLVMNRKPINGTNLAAMLVRYPWMTAKVIAAIYWQAFRLWLKRTPYYSHPNAR